MNIESFTTKSLNKMYDHAQAIYDGASPEERKELQVEWAVYQKRVKEAVGVVLPELEVKADVYYWRNTDGKA